MQKGELTLSWATWLLQKLKQAELNVKDHGALLQREMATWKASCEKMTASLSRKEMEVQQLHKKLDDYHTQVRAVGGVTTTPRYVPGGTTTIPR